MTDTDTVRLPVVYDGNADLSIIDPGSGEAVVLADADAAAIARWRSTVRELEELLREAKKLVDSEVLKRMDAAGEWTLRAGGMKLTAPSPAAGRETEWTDIEQLRDALALEAGVSRELIDAAFEPVTEFKPRAAGIGRLRKLAREDINALLDRHATTVDKARRVSVKAAA